MQTSNNYNIFKDCYYINHNKLLNTLNGNESLLFRYLYLCSFMDEHNKLYFQGDPVVHKDFMGIFGLNRNLNTRVTKTLEDLDLMYKIKKQYYINPHYCTRDKFIIQNQSGYVFCITDYGIRKLYKQAVPRKHTLLGKYFSLLEYTNKYYNVICSKETTGEIDYNRINFLNGVQICDMCDRSNENSSLFFRDLKEFIINDQPLICYSSSIHYNLNPFVVSKISYNKEDTQ